ncbi:hypothetical protein TcCL_NonESM04738, partial [Trypanosoma cruzi]
LCALYFRACADGCNYLPFPVMPRVCHDTSLRRARGAIDHAILSNATALFGCVIRLCGGSVEGRTWMGRAYPTAAPHFAGRPDRIAVLLLLALAGLATS